MQTANTDRIITQTQISINKNRILHIRLPKLFVNNRF